MTERERYQKRKAYFVEYAKRNRQKRRETARRWRMGISREVYNAKQAEYNRKYRLLNGATPRPKPVKVAQEVEKPKLVLTGETLRERFAAYRTLKNKAS